ncbi:hypothetical protein L228DRAFT_245267 [Xylona heveae TC161]|uniref:Uncharacterized protein n=1 Tax=Xylona heveae (strain CBS 132557 / TC161) TaxID=1328760 RepID=A0A165I3X1_XYLHT|nr:hypothetical protein L228DRAFT_245267 [Xylona heveae TC161]KZF24344.1 hypothetical protein L228DRAFT_245267 [Xylona heveae TC161]
MAARSKSLNVFKKPLAVHSLNPVTGFTRSGYCETPRGDVGNHSVAGILTDQFLDFSASRGNDLRSIGLKGGCRWCLCASRWKEALLARKGDNDDVVPRVVLSATNEKALDDIPMEDLRKFAAEE